MNKIIHKRKETAYLKSITEILDQEMHNVNLYSTTVTGVKLSKDFSNLIVYVHFFKNKKKSLEVLQKSSGYISKLLSYNVNQYKVPKIIFKYDESIDIGLKIEKIIKDIHKK